MVASIYESDIEEMAIDEFKAIGYSYIHGSNILPEINSEIRKSYSEVILKNHLFDAIRRLNPSLPEDALNIAYKKILELEKNGKIDNNEIFHKYLIEGIPIEYNKNGKIIGDFVYILSPDKINLNEFLVVNQFTIVEKGIEKRPDIIIYLNGLPIVVFELKNPADENATLEKAYSQLSTYITTIPQLFVFNEICGISDGLEAKVGSHTASFSRFTSWRINGKSSPEKKLIELLEVIDGIFDKNTLIDYITHFITFEESKTYNADKKTIQYKKNKKIAAYHQYYAVNKAVEKTLLATTNKSGKAGVVWHTQGSGKSLSMVFYAGKLVNLLNNPTIVVITDRNDLDDQLFQTFCNNKSILHQDPKEVENPAQLKEYISVVAGNIVFTTMQKFHPPDGETAFDLLSSRRNIVVIVDEAHRTQYGFDAKMLPVKDKDKKIVGQRLAYGYAKYLRDALPNATYIGFTGTPIESDDVNTPAIFGDYIDIYDIAQAIKDKVTVNIYYEGRFSKISITDDGRNLIDEFDTKYDSPSESSFDDVALSVAKEKWTALESIIGNPIRIRNIATDIVSHFEKRQSVFSGKAIVVTMSRKIAVDLYNEIIKIKPEWYGDDISNGSIKVVMTSASSDGPELQKHHTSKGQREILANRMKDINDPLKIAIVRDMWLTGFDAPCLHTMYIDKPMRSHNLMQAIARVNRVFYDKPGGLIVDYIGIGPSLSDALKFYAESGGKGNPIEKQERAIEILCDKITVVRQMLSGFDYSNFTSLDTISKLQLILDAEDFILSIKNGKQRFISEVELLSRAFALSKPNQTALQYSEEIALFQAIKARLIKFSISESSNSSNIDSVVKDLILSSITSEGVIDVFESAGIAKPQLSILSDEFLNEVKAMKTKNVAVALLNKLLSDEIHGRFRKNITKSKSLMEMLERILNKYQNNILTTAEILDELINLAKEIKDSDNRKQSLDLTDDELAFYDALSLNNSAIDVLGDDKLCEIARAVTTSVRNNTTIDWDIKESARAKLIVIVKRILRKYGYPPDQQKSAIDVVLKQAKCLADSWVTVE